MPARARIVRGSAQLVIEVLAIGDPGQAVDAGLALRARQVGAQPVDLARCLPELLLQLHRPALHLPGRIQDVADQGAQLAGLRLLAQRVAEADQLVRVAGRIAGHAADMAEQLGHRRLDALAGLVEQAQLAPGAKEAIVQLGQNVVAEPFAPAFQRQQAAAQLRVAAGTMAVPDQIVVRGRRDAMTGHGGQRGLGEQLRLIDQIDRDHLVCDYARQVAMNGLGIFG